MKYLLCAINTKYIHSNPAVYILRDYALRHCKDLEADALETAEFTINHRMDEVLGEIYERQPDVLFFSCYIWNFEYVQEAAENLHKVLPETEIWFGGPEVSFGAEDTVRKNQFLKGIMVGEGEYSFLQLLRYYHETFPLRKQAGSARHGDPLSLQEIPGLCFRETVPGDRIITTKAPVPISMDDVPFIYTDQNLSCFDHKILYYESSRGCPFSCSYCLSSVTRAVRFRSLDLVYRELQFFLDHRVVQVKFIDRTFNIDSQRSAAILAYLQEHDNGVTNFHFEIAGELLTEKELQIMEQMRPGLIQLEIGVQSTNPDTLEQIHRKADLTRLKQVVGRLIQAKNIHLHLDLIAGLPQEEYPRFARSFNEVYTMRPTQLQLGFLKVLKGTEIQRRVEEYGIRYTGGTPYEVLETRWISYAQIRKLKQIEEMVEIYYNSRQFTRTLAVLETEFPDPFTMYDYLAGFYKEQGYFRNSPSRISRYQVLLDFIRKYCKKQEALYRELLTFDLYYRENLKSRPDFMPDRAMYKSLLREQDKHSSNRTSLHREVFHYPVHKETPGEIMDPAEIQPRVVTFDYSQRSPLDHNAAVVVQDIEAEFLS